jgi:KEOPS complex subunit Cgi121
MFVVENFHVYVSHAILEEKLNPKIITKLVNALNSKESNLEKSSLVIIDAEAIAGLKHLQACIHFGIKSFQQKLNIARSLKAEILLYLSGYRQISKAIERVGLSELSNEIIMIQLVELDTQNANEKIPLFEFDLFLKELSIKFDQYSSDINNFKPRKGTKVKTNLEIKDEIISLFINPNDPNYSKESVLEKLAIEKSAQLNLIK